MRATGAATCSAVAVIAVSSVLALTGVAAAQADEPGITGGTTAPPLPPPPSEGGGDPGAQAFPASAPHEGTPQATFARARQQCQPGSPCPLWNVLVRFALQPELAADALDQICRLRDPRGAVVAAQGVVYGAGDRWRAAARACLERLARDARTRRAVWRIARNDPDSALRGAAGAALGEPARRLLAASARAPASLARERAAPSDRAIKEHSPDHTRVVFGSTAVGRPRGRAAWAVFNLGWHQLDYGVTDNVQVGIGALIPVGAAAFMPHVKLGGEIAEDTHLALQLQGGVFYPYIANNDSLLIGVYGGGPLLSYASDRLLINASLPIYGIAIKEERYSYWDVRAPGSVARAPAVTHHWVLLPSLGISGRVSRSLALNLELHVPLSSALDVNGEVWLVLYGLRIFGEHLFGDVSFVIPIFPDADELLQYTPIGLPLLSLGYRW